MKSSTQAALEADRQKKEKARLKNLEFLKRKALEQEEKSKSEEYREGDDDDWDHAYSDGKRQRVAGNSFSISGLNAAPVTTSAYVQGVSTAVSRKQLELACKRIGRMKRIKFYKDSNDEYKGDALVTFTSAAAMLEAIKKLHGFEIAPGAKISVTVAEFPSSSGAKNKEIKAPSLPINTQSEEGDGDGESFEEEERMALSRGLMGFEAPDQQPAPSPAAQPTLQPTRMNDFDVRVSRTVILCNVFDVDEASKDPNFMSDLEEDMLQECQTFGKVESVECMSDGNVCVCFAELASSARCLKAMNGRWFDQRLLSAHYDPSQLEEPQDEDAKLEGFLAFIATTTGGSDAGI